MCNGSDQLADIEGTKHCVDAAGDNVRRKRNTRNEYVARETTQESGECRLERVAGLKGEGGEWRVASDTL